MDGGEQKLTENCIRRLVDRLFVRRRKGVQPRLRRRFLEPAKRIAYVELALGMVERGQDDRNYVTPRDRPPCAMAIKPELNVALFQFSDRKGAAKRAELIEVAPHATFVFGVNRSCGKAPLAEFDEP